MHTYQASAFAGLPAALADAPPPVNPLAKLLLTTITLAIVVHILSPSIDLRPAPRAPRVVRVTTARRPDR